MELFNYNQPMPTILGVLIAIYLPFSDNYTFLRVECAVLNFHTIEPQKPAEACVIWLHGLGANGADMRGVVDAFPAMDVAIRHVFVDAPVRPVTLNNHMSMPAWYDLTGLTLQDRDDQVGILQSERALDEIIALQIDQGFQPQKIYLAGFSQGGAMALFVGLRSQRPLGGIVALSAYLPLRRECSGGQHLTLPIFMATGLADPIVIPAWTKLSYDFVRSQRFSDTICKDYPMGHTICLEEIRDVSHWLQTKIQHSVKQGETI
jgi:phospholipase/carboxylesterase